MKCGERSTFNAQLSTFKERAAGCTGNPELFLAFFSPAFVQSDPLVGGMNGAEILKIGSK
jgi:hypothetical protein